MSATDGSDLETSSSAFVHTPTPFEYAVTHVFLPLELPSDSDYTLENDLALAHAVCAAAHAYSTHVHGTSEPQWHRITRMLDNLEASVQSEHLDRGHVISQLCGMRTGDFLAFFIRPQNAAIVLTKRGHCTVFESFEVSPRSDAVEATGGSLICSYPGSAIETLNNVFDDEDFQFEFANFLSRPSVVNSDFPPPPPSRPQYITALLTGILRCVGRAIDVPCITKRVRDNVGPWPPNYGRDEGADDWRRSSLWLLIRVAIQTSLDRSPPGRASYKQFMLFFICTLARDANNTNLSSDLLHLMSSKIFRRLGKLGSSIPDWLCEMALKTCACLREILDARWTQLSTRPSPFRNPSQQELVRDTQLSLLDSREYIRRALSNSGHEPPGTPFHPSHNQRGTIDDFLSSNGIFFEKAYDTDPDITLYDVEQSVEQGIDDWLARVTNVEEACIQLEILMDKYMTKAANVKRRKKRIAEWQQDENPEDASIMFLTAIELFVALDKLVLKEIPMLADYPPEIPISSLEKLLLRKTTSLHRLARAYQYLFGRQSRSRPGWSVLSDKFTGDSFAVRYYDQSPPLQQLKARIERDVMIAGHVGIQQEVPCLARTCDGHQENSQQLSGRRSSVSRPPLPASSLHAKVVVFELQCPTHFHIWRSAASRILYYLYYSARTGYVIAPEEECDNLLVHVSGLQPYFVGRTGPPLSFQIHFAYFYPGGSHSPTIRYAMQHNKLSWGDGPMDCLSIWQAKEYLNDEHLSLRFAYSNGSDYQAKYMNSTSHTSNNILALQADCPMDLALDEFIAFGHLRSGGSLQWLNILHGLRSRTLNFRRQEVHILLSHAAFQVGPLDLDTGVWLWHKELQDSSFCDALLNELNSLFVEVGAGSIDGVMMSTISLLLTRVVVSSPSERVSERAIALLQSIRRKVFSWVQELSYNLVMAPTHAERGNLLRDMAATCRSTFDVDSATLHKLFHSAEDVDAVLSCAFLISTLYTDSFDGNYSQLLLQRDYRLAHALEGILRERILVDPSDCSVDLAVGKIFAQHKPSAHRWEQLQCPNARWFTCRTKATGDKPSQTVHLNLFDGALRVDGQLLVGLLRAIRESPECPRIFHDQGFFLVPSNLPGMNFMTESTTTSQYKVHFSLRDDDLVVRAQCNPRHEILQLIPSSQLSKDLPPALVDGHVHWLNISTEIIEICPLEQPWEQSSENWKIDCASGQYRMYKGRETLVDIRSPTWAMVSKCFEGLNIGEDFKWGNPSRNLLITTSPIDSCTRQSVPLLQLSITLPLYGLSFFVNERAELESRDFKDMVYDEDQCVGALFGLENLLVLRQKTHLPEEVIPRYVLIPNGFLEKHGNHQVQIGFSHVPGAPLYHAYNVDTELGCLIGNGGLISTQYLACLHAATSWSRPDPLTGKTGAQAALCLLQSAGCRSIMNPGHLYSIPLTSEQYPQLNTAYSEIQHRYYWNRDVHFSEAFRALRKRAARRAVYLFPSNATGPTSTEDCDDMDYLTMESDLELESVAFAAASALHHWSLSMPTMNTISNWADLWTRNNVLVDTTFSPLLHDDPEAWSDFDLAQALMAKVHDILEKREATRQRFQLLFLLPTTAFCSPCHQVAFFSMLIAFAQQPQSQSSSNPLIHADCKISDGYRPTDDVLRYHIHNSRLRKQYCDTEERRVDGAVKHLLKGWPSDTPPTVLLDSCYWDIASLTARLQQLFSSCRRNFYLKEHLIRVLTEPGLPTRPPPVSSPQYILNECTPWQIALDQLLSSRTAPELPPRSILLRCSYKGSRTSSDNIPTLHRLFSSLRTDSSFQQEYLTHLDVSAQSAREESRMTHTVAGENRIETLKKHYVQCRVNYMDGLATLKQNLGPTADPHEQAHDQRGQWPPITADVLLRYLASTSPIKLSRRWKKCLISLALLLLELQRARRLLRFALDGLEEEFSKELENEGCDGWNPEEYPDWLLIQVQGNFLIRRIQAETAMKMMFPQSGENTVMQVNMGEGKSSVVIPIAAATLADGNQLVRVIVPKVLTVQMLELLVARLGGLANRPIYYLPFSRSPKYGSPGKVISPQIDDLHKLTSQCITERGILLAQPEHVASLKLMSTEEQIRNGKHVADPLPKLHKFIFKHILSPKSLRKHSIVGNIFQSLTQSPGHSSKMGAARANDHDGHGGDTHGASDNASKWLGLQRWTHSHVRDILDESDEILHARFQLIYTIGLQQHMDGYPDRWMITQQVLRLVRKHAYSLSRNHPNSMEYECDPPGSFPHIRIVRASDVGRRLISLIVEDVMIGGLPNFNFQHISAALHRAIRSFISDEDVFQVPATVKMVEEYAMHSHHSYIWSGLLLLRGLLASNMLLFALTERRWRVDYGLDLPSRDSDRSLSSTMLAVPYRAKDVPAPNTHFGHPDITIILTCLSYYYAGLSEEQLRISFGILLDQDDPSMEYPLWVNDYDWKSVPDSLQELREINLKSSEQWDKFIFPLFSRNQATIDFYLSRVVFPQEAKEFPSKLCASSWDLAEKREKVITGFSGTNDNRWLLPLSIAQRDLNHQRGTNATVLAYLLQPENNSYVVTHENGERWTTLRFLQMVAMQQPTIRALFDVGAQILDRSNKEVAKAWLDITRDAAGAVYFDENDEMRVLTKNGITQSILSSPLSQQLDRCVVYLDHAHTRGTDLKLPIGSRAAVTLGPKVTKDHLVQGCMRMRKLGHGHSVMFFAPLEVDQSIRTVVGKMDPNTRVTTVDILCWAIHETWTDIQRRASHWAQQGMSHKSRSNTWTRFCNNELGPDELSDAWLQPERKSLADLYAPSETKGASSTLSELDPAIRQRCKDFGVLSLPNAQMEEEQEREVNREREREREVELPPTAEPAEHSLHPDVIKFVKTGDIPPLHASSAFHPVFTTLEQSSAATHDADVWSPYILATVDFCQTIKPDTTLGTMDQYLRPVQWILSRQNLEDRDQILVLLSPFEVDHLLSDIRASEHVHLHLYAPRTSQRMKPSDDLKLYSIPPLPSDWTPPWALIDQLNVFAGQLYLRDYQSYLRLCRFLDVPTKDSPNDTAIRWNVFNIPGSFEEEEIKFSGSTLPSVWALLAIRSRGRPFTQTHMGKILQGQILTEKDFERSTSVVSGHNPPISTTTSTC